MRTRVEEVRKHGMMKVSDKMEALEIIDEAADQDYTFGYKKHGWSHLVVDLDD